MRRTVSLLTALLAVPAALTGIGIAASAGTASAASKAAEVFPSVTGSYGTTPKLTFPKGTAPKALEKKVLVQGKGPVTKKGDLIAVNYLGQIWGGKVFDSSFSRHQLFGTGIGVNQVITGWDKTLVGVHVGSRVLLVIPPADGYGPTGNTGAGITGKDDIVFVVDVTATYDASSQGDAHATKLASDVGGVTVTGKLGAQPKISIKKGTTQPKALKVTVLDRGNGPKTKAGMVVVQLLATNWSGVVQESTWSLGTPAAFNLDQQTGATFPNDLVGIPVGSRVLVDYPKTSSGGPFALVIDLVAQPNDPQKK